MPPLPPTSPIVVKLLNKFLFPENEKFGWGKPSSLKIKLDGDKSLINLCAKPVSLDYERLNTVMEILAQLHTDCSGCHPFPGYNIYDISQDAYEFLDLDVAKHFNSLFNAIFWNCAGLYPSQEGPHHDVEIESQQKSKTVPFKYIYNHLIENFHFDITVKLLHNKRRIYQENRAIKTQQYIGEPDGTITASLVDFRDISKFQVLTGPISIWDDFYNISNKLENFDVNANYDISEFNMNDSGNLPLKANILDIDKAIDEALDKHSETPFIGAIILDTNQENWSFIKHVKPKKDQYLLEYYCIVGSEIKYMTDIKDRFLLLKQINRGIPIGVCCIFKTHETPQEIVPTWTRPTPPFEGRAENIALEAALAESARAEAAIERVGSDATAAAAAVSALLPRPKKSKKPAATPPVAEAVARAAEAAAAVARAAEAAAAAARATEERAAAAAAEREAAERAAAAARATEERAAAERAAAAAAREAAEREAAERKAAAAAAAEVATAETAAAAAREAAVARAAERAAAAAAREAAEREAAERAAAERAAAEREAAVAAERAAAENALVERLAAAGVASRAAKRPITTPPMNEKLEHDTPAARPRVLTPAARPRVLTPAAQRAAAERAAAEEKAAAAAKKAAAQSAVAAQAAEARARAGRKRSNPDSEVFNVDEEMLRQQQQQQQQQHIPSSTLARSAAAAKEQMQSAPFSAFGILDREAAAVTRPSNRLAASLKAAKAQLEANRAAGRMGGKRRYTFKKSKSHI